VARKRTSGEERRLIAAYRNIFNGGEDADLVIKDLASWSGFYQVTPPEMPNDQVKFAEGGRRVFARILASLRMTDAEIRALEEAARIEALTSNREG